MSLIIGDNAHDNNDLKIAGTTLSNIVNGTSATLTWSSVENATRYIVWKKNNDRWVKIGETTEINYNLSLDWSSTQEYSVSAMNDTRFIGNMANTVTITIGENPDATVNELYGYSVGQIVNYKALYDGYDSYSYIMSNGHSKIVEIKPNTRIKFKLENGSYVAGNDITGIYVNSRPMYPLKNVFITTTYKEMTTVIHYGVDNGYNSAHGGAHPPIYAPYDCVITAARNYDGGAKGIYCTFKYTYNGRTVTNQYEHMQSINVVAGQSVSKGTIIGYMGDTGEGGNHLHISTGNGNIDNQTTRAQNATDPMDEYWFDSSYHMGDGTMSKYNKVNIDGDYFQLMAK